MRRPLSLRTKIPRGFDDADAEILLPETVDRDPRRQRLVRGDQPARPGPAGWAFGRTSAAAAGKPARRARPCPPACRTDRARVIRGAAPPAPGGPVFAARTAPIERAVYPTRPIAGSGARSSSRVSGETYLHVVFAKLASLIPAAMVRIEPQRRTDLGGQGRVLATPVAVSRWRKPPAGAGRCFRRRRDSRCPPAANRPR